MNKRFDIVVIGGGITGSVTALLLQKAGYSTAIIERSGLGKFKAGESLTPRCKRWLEGLGVSFDVAEAVEYFGVHSSWGSDERTESSFIFNPYGNGLALDRSHFELKLIDEAKKRGADVSLSMEIKTLRFENGAWEIETENETGPSTYRAGLVIAATGRNSFQAIDTCKHLYYDNQVALSVVYTHSISDVIERYLTVEALSEGWFYSNHLPGMKMIISIIIDADLIPVSKSRGGFFLQHVQQTGWSRSNVLPPPGECKIFASDARMRWTENQSGNYWLRIGDAGYTIDPLSGQGIEKNLEMIFFCVEKVELFLKNAGNVHKRYLDFNGQRFSKYLEQRRAVYEAEQRWTNNVYWKRRIQEARAGVFQIRQNLAGFHIPGNVVARDLQDKF